MAFPLNSNGGWIVPANSVIPAGTVVPAYSVIGHSTILGAGCTVGSDVSFGKQCSIGHVTTIGDDCEFGYSCYIGKQCAIGSDATLHDWCRVDNNTRIASCVLGNSNTLSKGVTIRGHLVVKFMTLGNISGSGRQILLIHTGKELVIIAGCFTGSLAQFLDKAESENKKLYVSVVAAAARALVSTVKNL